MKVGENARICSDMQSKDGICATDEVGSFETAVHSLTMEDIQFLSFVRE